MDVELDEHGHDHELEQRADAGGDDEVDDDDGLNQRAVMRSRREVAAGLVELWQDAAERLVRR